MQDPIWTIEVPAACSGERLDVFLTGALNARGEAVSRAQIQRLIAGGSVRVGNKLGQAKQAVRSGEKVMVIAALAVRATSQLAPVSMPLAILFEDEHLIVLNKPAGLAVHPGAGTSAPTLVQGLLAHCQTLGQAIVHDAVKQGLAAERPGIVHRLDKDTTGAMVCAKTDQAHAGLAKQFHDKTNRREYVALLDGVLAAGEIRKASFLHRDSQHRTRFASLPVPADATHPSISAGTRRYRYAESFFRCEATFAGRLCLARITLKTGRTHQIRVHAQDLGTPVWGDLVYGRASQLPQTLDLAVRQALAAVTRQLLHAEILGFVHPVTGAAMEFRAPYPHDFLAILERLAPYRQSQALR